MDEENSLWHGQIIIHLVVWMAKCTHYLNHSLNKFICSTNIGGWQHSWGFWLLSGYCQLGPLRTGEVDECWEFIRGCFGNQLPWKGREESKTRQRDKLSCESISTATSVIPWGVCLFLADPCGIQDLVPQPGIKPVHPAMEGQSVNHRTTWQVHGEFWSRDDVSSWSYEHLYLQVHWSWRVTLGEEALSAELMLKEWCQPLAGILGEYVLGS